MFSECVLRSLFEVTVKFQLWLWSFDEGKSQTGSCGQHENKSVCARCFRTTQVTEIDTERETTSKNRLNYQNVTDRLSIWTGKWGSRKENYTEPKLMGNPIQHIEISFQTHIFLTNGFFLRLFQLSLSNPCTHDPYRIFTLASTNRKINKSVFVFVSTEFNEIHLNLHSEWKTGC